MTSSDMQEVRAFEASRAAPNHGSRQAGQTLVALGGLGGIARLRSSTSNGLPCKCLDGEPPPPTCHLHHMSKPCQAGQPLVTGQSRGMRQHDQP